MELVSFLMPAYNAEKYIGEAIESCLNQTYENIEICIVNDGSTDQTGAIIEEYAREFRYIHFFSFPENKGKISAFNKTGSLSFSVG